MINEPLPEEYVSEPDSSPTLEQEYADSLTDRENQANTPDFEEA